MADRLKPQFFLIRQNNNMVPLVPMDELPDFISVRGVGRSLSPTELTGMTCVGEVESRHRLFLVENLNQSPYTPLKTPDSMVETETKSLDDGDVGSNNPSSCSSSSSSSSSSGSVGASVETLRPISPVTSAVPEALTPTKNTVCYSKKDTDSTEDEVPLPGKKVYCAFWMRRGECDYAQQGCAYKHEMPKDPKVLEACGYRDIPNWYREKYGLGSLKATPGSGAALGGNGMAARHERTQHDWRSPVNKPERIKTFASVDKRRHFEEVNSTNPARRGPSRPANGGHIHMQNKNIPRARSFGAKTVSQPQSPAPNTEPSSITRTKIENLLQLDTYECGPREKRGTSLLDSKYAPLQPERSSSSTGSSTDRRPIRRPRAPSTASAITDIEAEFAREESARKTAEDRHYAAIVREQANKDRDAAVDKARESLDLKIDAGGAATKDIPKGPRAALNGQGGRNISRGSGVSGANGWVLGKRKGGQGRKRRNAIPPPIS